MDYRHFVYLTYETAEQLNRHAARLIDREGFYSGGVQSDETYLFQKQIDEATFNKLIGYGREKIVTGGKTPVSIVIEKRIAW